MKIREEITKIEAKNTIEKSIKQGVDFFLKKEETKLINLARFTKKKRERTQIRKIRNKKEYSKHLDANRLDNQFGQI